MPKQTSRLVCFLFASLYSPISQAAVPFRQHPVVYSFKNDEAFRRSTSQGNWLIFFHNSADRTVLDDIPDGDNTGGIRLAAMEIRQAHETMRRFQVRRIPSFLCLRHGTHYYHYSTQPYTWSALIEYCSHPPEKDAYEFPPPLPLWKEMRTRVKRNVFLQIAIAIMVMVLGGFVASCCSHFFDSNNSNNNKQSKVKAQ